MLATLAPGRLRRVPEDAVALLRGCHDRIRSYLALAQRLAAARGSPEAEVAEAAEQVRRYFASAFLLHVRDEEELVFPLLKGLEPEVDTALARVCEEHGAHELGVSRLIAASGLLAASPGRLPELGPEIAEAAGALAPQMDEHLRCEEALLFPAFERLLDTELRARAFEEMRRRRR
jgi:iron-sulfur cluster repair protein YtfE (RIC family)